MEQIMMKFLIRYSHAVTKVGFALKIDDIPEKYPQRQEVIKWESRYWDKDCEISKDVYRADIDTTFAIYKPGYRHYTDPNFYTALRMAGLYTALHGGWYIDPKNMTTEQMYYFQNASNSSSWKFNEKGELNNENFIKAYKESNN